jgi:hypothetical protein
MSWGQIARGLNTNRSTVRSVYARIRTDSAAKVSAIESSLCEKSAMAISGVGQKPNFTP